MHLLLCLMTSFASFAATETPANMLKFNYKSEETEKVIRDYAAVSGQKFIVNPNVKGKVTIINKTPISADEAFSQLSSALAQESLAISKQGDTMIVSGARNIQRDLIETGSELPALRPEKMFTWIITLKYVSADEINKQLRILTSKDGELVPFTPRNQLLITDWVSNLHRIQKILTAVDVPAESKSKN